MNFLETNKNLLDNAIEYYYSIEEQEKYFGKKPKSRYFTFRYCFDNINNNVNPVIVELGTSRSFVDGRFEGCNSDDSKYWEPNNPKKWDWSAGIFTKVFSTLFPNSIFYITEIGLYNSNKDLMILSKLQYPVLRQGIQQFLIKYDF